MCRVRVFCSHQRSRAGIPSIRRPASRETISDLSTVQNRSLFLTHPIYGKRTCDFQICTQFSLKSILSLLDISGKVRFLKRSQPALACSVSRMAMLLKFTCVMNVRNHSSQAFVTSSGPFGDCSCKFVYRPKNVKSINSCKIQASQDTLRANFGFSPTVSSTSFLKFWSSKQKIETLYNCCLFSSSVHNIFQRTFIICCSIFRPQPNPKQSCPTQNIDCARLQLCSRLV